MAELYCISFLLFAKVTKDHKWPHLLFYSMLLQPYSWVEKRKFALLLIVVASDQVTISLLSCLVRKSMLLPCVAVKLRLLAKVSYMRNFDLVKVWCDWWTLLNFFTRQWQLMWSILYQAAIFIKLLQSFSSVFQNDVLFKRYLLKMKFFSQSCHQNGILWIHTYVRRWLILL